MCKVLSFWRPRPPLHQGAPDDARSRPASSPEWRLVEAPELARVERIVLTLQEADRGDADLQMFGDGPLVEGVRGAGKLDLAVQRLVRDAEQRAIGHAHAEALGGDGRRFHVDGDGARDVDEAALLRPAQFPVAVVVGYDGAGAQAALQRFAAIAGDLRHRLL